MQSTEAHPTAKHFRNSCTLAISGVRFKYLKCTGISLQTQTVPAKNAMPLLFYWVGSLKKLVISLKSEKYAADVMWGHNLWNINRLNRKMIAYFGSSQHGFLCFHFSLFLSKHLCLTQTFGLMITSKFSRTFSLSVTKYRLLEAEVKLRGRTFDSFFPSPSLADAVGLGSIFHMAPLTAERGGMTEY